MIPPEKTLRKLRQCCCTAAHVNKHTSELGTAVHIWKELPSFPEYNGFPFYSVSQFPSPTVRHFVRTVGFQKWTGDGTEVRRTQNCNKTRHSGEDGASREAALQSPCCRTAQRSASSLQEAQAKRPTYIASSVPSAAAYTAQIFHCP